MVRISLFSLSKSKPPKNSSASTPTSQRKKPKTPVYVCLLLHVNELEKIGIEITEKKLQELKDNRNKFTTVNSGVDPKKFYSAVELLHIDYEELYYGTEIPVSGRLFQILNSCHLKTRIETDWEKLELCVEELNI